MNLVELAQRIRTLRKERGLSLKDLAKSTQLTGSVLSKVENFRVTPSLPALGRIASALGVTVSELVEGLDEKPRLTIVRKNERKIVARDKPKSKFIYHALAYRRASKAMEPFLVEIPGGEARKQLLAHEDDEFFIILEGDLDFEYGDEIFHLNKDDCVYADGNVKHRLVNKKSGQAKILIVFSKPR